MREREGEGAWNTGRKGECACLALFFALPEKGVWLQKVASS